MGMTVIHMLINTKSANPFLDPCAFTKLHTASLWMSIAALPSSHRSLPRSARSAPVSQAFSPRFNNINSKTAVGQMTVTIYLSFPYIHSHQNSQTGVSSLEENLK